MEPSTYNNLSCYQEIKPLSGKENVILVKNTVDGKKYVKKRLKSYDLGVYKALAEKPVENMPKIYGLYFDNGSLIVIEEYIEGTTIKEHLATNKLFSEAVTTEVAKQLCKTLNKLHRCKPAIIHRDIKPSNVIITPDNRVVLIDLNAAKFEKKHENTDTVLLGTVGYAAPEQYGFGSSTPQTDIYALGVLMNIMLTGFLPSEKLGEGKLKRIIKRCVELNPKDRYGSADKLSKDLKRYKSRYISWLPPGFRSFNIFKMLVACLGYYAIVWSSYELALDFEAEGSICIA